MSREIATSQRQWTEDEIVAEKSAIKKELDALSDPKDPEKRLNAALEGVSKLEHDTSPLGFLRRYVYIMSALVHHEAHGGLQPRDIERLVDLAYAILQIRKIVPRSTVLASLYGDLHLIRSQIYRRLGNAWRAAWEQETAMQLAGRFPSGGQAFQRLVMANRLMRLGHGHVAIGMYRAAEALDLAPKHRQRNRLELIVALWLNNQGKAARDLLHESIADPVFGAIKDNLDWQKLVFEFYDSGDLRPLIRETRKGERFFNAAFVIETCLLGLSAKSRTFLDRVPKLASLARNKDLQPRKQGAWFEAVSALQNCYDTSISMPLRMKQLGTMLEARWEFLGIDQELLFLGAALRWAIRARATHLIVLLWGEYSSLSLRLTGGATKDVLILFAEEREKFEEGLFGREDDDEQDVDFVTGP